LFARMLGAQLTSVTNTGALDSSEWRAPASGYFTEIILCCNAAMRETAC
jgi:hypothetical protein